MTSWAYTQSQRSWSGGVGMVLTIGIHLGVLALILAARPSVISYPVPINVSVISDTPQQNEPQEIPLNQPRLNQPKLHIPQPDVVLPDDAPSATAPVAVSSAASSTPQPPATASVTQPVFDADYLKNPQPAYPPLSRRMREQGTVLVRVLVSAEGLPDQVEVKSSSGSMRLDDAALCAVKKWRFVPARRGSQTVAAWVVVPIAFSLTV